LPFAADPFLYHPLKKEKRFDIAMVANFNIEGPSVIQKAHILARLCREGFRIRAITKGIERHFKEFPELNLLDIIDEYYSASQVNELYNETKIVLAVNSPHAKSDPAVRVMEIAASGNFQIAEYRENTKKLMGETVVEFNSLDDLVEKVKFYLDNKKERERLALASYQLVLAKHTIRHRAEQVLKEIYG
jgi:spore maturation protein CgeB